MSTSTERRQRPPNTDFSTKPCPGDWAKFCKDIQAWGEAFDKWGNSVLAELDEIKDAICHLEQNAYYGGSWNKGVICNKDGRIVVGGTPPTNSTQPPPPPFRP